MIPVMWNDVNSATCICKLLGIISESGENYVVEDEPPTEERTIAQTPMSETFNVNN